MTGRGRGLAAIGVRGSQRDDRRDARRRTTTWDPSQRLGTGARRSHPRAVAALAENGRGTIAWQAAEPGGPGAADRALLERAPLRGAGRR